PPVSLDILFSPRSRAPPHLHSFPTRRSSDLTTLDATAPQGTVGAGGVGPIWTAVLVSSTAAGFTGLGLGIKAVSRPKPQNCVVVDRKSTRLNSSHGSISYAVFCLKKKRLSEK